MRKYSEMDGKYITAKGLEIYYRELGSGRPLILLHGATDTHRYWDPILPSFSERYRVITPDSRGHGLTFNPEPALSYAVMAEDLAGLIKALGLDSPLIFGYSDGGQAALEFGIRYPDLAGALVIGGVWFQFSQPYQEALRRTGFLPEGEIDYAVFERQAPRDWEDRMRQAHADPRPDYPRILLSNLAAMWWTPLNYSDEDLLEMRVPTLILMGEEDEMIPWQEVRDLAEKLPQGEFRLIPGANHTGVIIKEGLFLDIVFEFLERQGAESSANLHQANNEEN